MDILKRILLGLVICIGSFHLSICAAEDTPNIKQEIALLKNQLQNLKLRVASAEQTTQIDTSNDVSTPPAKHHKKKHAKKIKAAKKQEKSAQSRSVRTVPPAEIISPAV